MRILNKLLCPHLRWDRVGPVSAFVWEWACTGCGKHKRFHEPGPVQHEGPYPTRAKIWDSFSFPDKDSQLRI